MSAAPRQLGILLAAGAAGALGLLAQCLLLREELLLYGGNEIALGAFFTLWLAGIGTGAVAVRFLKPGQRAATVAVPLLLVQGALPLVATIAARLARTLAGVPAYESFPLAALFLWSIPVAVPVALCTGALVPALAARARAAGGDVTSVYVAEALGSLGGGVSASLLLAAGIEPATLLLGCGVIGAAGSVALTNGWRRLALAGVALAAAATAAFSGPAVSDGLRRQRLAAVLPGATLLDARETASASLMLAELGAQQVLLADGHVVAAFPDGPRVERDAGLLAALSGGPHRLLVIGAEATDLLGGALALGGIEHVTWMIGDPGLSDFAMRHIPGLSSDARLDVVLGDPLRSRAALAARAPFDAIWLMVDMPLRRADARFVASETLARLAATLTPKGVLVVPVRGAENFIGPRQRLALGSVIAGVAGALGHARLIPGADGVVLGARAIATLDLDPDRLQATYRSMAPRTERLTRDGLASRLEARRLRLADSLVASLRTDPHVEPSRLDRPLALFNNLLVRAEKESSELARALEALHTTGTVLWVPLLVVALFAIAATAGKRNIAATTRTGALCLLTVGGALGMGLDLVLLHLYQGRFGTLYLEVGWLFGLWMGGLALGGALGKLAVANRRLGAVGAGMGVTICLGVLCSSLAGFGAAALPTRAVAAFAFVLAGSLSGAIIPVSEALLATAGVFGARAGIGIEAADHLGGAACALILGVLGVPILGVTQSAAWLAGLCGVGALLLGTVWVRRRRLLPAAVERWLTRAAVYESFPYRRTLLVLFAIATAAVAGHWVVHRILLGPRVRLDAPALAATGIAPPWHEVDEPVIHYRAANDDSGAPAIALASRAAAPDVRGYGGPVNLLVSTDAAAKITYVAFLAHNETPAYIEGADGYFAALAGKSILAPFAVSAHTFGVDPTVRTPSTTAQTIDGITGATVTSRAIARALEGVGRSLAQPVYQRAYAQTAGPTGLRDPHLIYLLLSLAAVIPIFVWGGKWLRRAFLLIHAGVGGLWLGVQLSTVQVLEWLRGGPNLDWTSWTGLLSATVLATALLGPIYCGYLCPAGALQEILGLFGRARALPASLDRPARFIKYVILTTLVACVLGFGSDLLLRADPLREAWASHRSGLGALLLLLIAVGSLFFVRFGCRYLCPTGAFLNLLNGVAPLRRWLPDKNYPACDLGVRGALDVDCLQCNRCRLGETAITSTGWRLNAFRFALAAALIVVALAVTPRGAADVHTVAGEVRPVDVELLRSKIRGDTLSGRRAEYWHVVRP